MNNLPQNRDVEDALLGAVLIDPSVMDERDVAVVKPDDFYIIKHQFIWEAFREVGKDLDIVSVSAFLEGQHRLNEVGGSAYLAGLIAATPTALHASEYARMLRDLARRRRDIQIANLIVKQAFEGDLDRAKVIELLTNNEKIDGGARHVSEALREFVNEVDVRSQNPREIWGLATGFIDLDKRIGGLQPEQTMLLAATPGQGKSVLAMQIAKNIAERGIGVAIYSFEMSARRVLMRLISADSGIPTRAMNTGYMGEHWDNFYEATAKLERLPLYIADIYGMTTASLRSDLARLRAQHNIQVIVVDYLNKLLDTDGGDDLANTKLKARRMQGICREFNVSGILIQSMNKEGMRTSTPTLADMSGPSDVAHEGDNVFLMAQHPEEKGVVQLYPAKMRDGDMGKAPISLRWATGVPKFVNYTSGEVKLEWYHN